MNQIGDMKFAQRQRFVFMESVAYWEGKVGRQRIAKVFSITENHVSRDFTRYREEFPDNLSYDLSARTYRPSKNFKPRVGTGLPSEYLALLRTYLECHSNAVVPTIYEGVNAATLPRPEAELDPAILHAVTRALSDGRGLEVSYQSLTSSEPSKRTLWPHALVYAGYRWHARAFDGKRERFADFVLHRILEAEPSDAAAPTAPADDYDWQTDANVDIGLAPSLNALQQVVVAKEYGMRQIEGAWVWRAQTKRCLVAYLRQAMRLDQSANASHPLVLLNADELKDLRFKDNEE